MAITYLGVHFTEYLGTNGGTSSGTINSSGGNLFMAPVWHSAGTPTISDNKSGSYSLGIEANYFGTQPLGLYYAPNAAGGSGHTLTVTLTAGFPRVGLSAFAGVHATPQDQTNHFDDLGTARTTVQAGSITPSEDNCLVIAAVMSTAGSAMSWSIDSGFTLIEGMANGELAFAYKIQTTAAAVNPIWTSSIGDVQCMAVIMAFKAVAVAADLSVLIGEPICGSSLLSA